MRRLSFLVLSLLVTWIASAQPVVFPLPARAVAGKGNFSVGLATEIRGNGAYADTLAETLKREIAALSALVQDPGEGCIDLRLDGRIGLDEEAYRLQVNGEGVTVEASTPSGLFYGAETLLQLILWGKGRIGACEIQDAPRYAWRGFMLDESRHFFGKEKVKQYLDLMAALKMNVFHWHLTDETGWRIEIRKYPKLTSVGAVGNWHDPSAPAAYYTQEEVREIVAYAAARHIMVVPEFDMPGHATAVGKSYPEISGGGEGRWEHFTYHPCKEETFEFISNVLDEIVALFPAPYIHIGGDEVHFGNQSWFTDPEIQRFIQEKRWTSWRRRGRRPSVGTRLSMPGSRRQRRWLCGGAMTANISW